MDTTQVLEILARTPRTWVKTNEGRIRIISQFLRICPIVAVAAEHERIPFEAYVNGLDAIGAGKVLSMSAAETYAFAFAADKASRGYDHILRSQILRACNLPED